VKKIIKSHLITNKIFLLADTDSKDEPYKVKRHQELEKLSRENFVYMQTGAVEVENILGASVIKKIINDLLKVDSSRMHRRFLHMNLGFHYNFKYTQPDYRNYIFYFD